MPTISQSSTRVQLFLIYLCCSMPIYGKPTSISLIIQHCACKLKHPQYDPLGYFHGWMLMNGCKSTKFCNIILFKFIGIDGIAIHHITKYWHI
jgi:hypothetical protein